MTNPLDNPALYDVFRLGGVRSPGLCKFDPPPVRDQGWDVQTAGATKGAGLARRTMPPVRFKVAIYLWKDENVDHFAGWDDWKRLLLVSSKSTGATALDINHPLCSALQPPITSVVVGPYNEPVPDGKGGATITIEFIEYRPPKTSAVVKPGGSTVSSNAAGAGAAGSKGDPNADLKAQLAQLTNTLNAP